MKRMYSQPQSGNHFSLSIADQVSKIVNQFDQDVASTTNHSSSAMHSHVKLELHDIMMSIVKTN
ncbi:hypothetical protein T11_3782 [Trichinella zimbabwensis]|uniref:Uncharacterized protein n=2 Tax=Trichinella TaxID=6333 RepID=A0A0V1HRS4_9BILA|nr:hypothetical protein T11_4657 [Trichinella zimbabwensis]KRZ13447.1 hypothetical protein T11_3782 [Trichinella zimbabwensis]KRZ73347.1 hypothetical protein T10_1929 [Trichinella papuae]